MGFFFEKFFVHFVIFLYKSKSSRYNLIHKGNYFEANMRKNLVVQLIYRIVLCCVSFLACLLSLRVFYAGQGGRPMSWEILKYYTNLSNYAVFVVSIAVTVATAARVLKGEREGYNRILRTFKFMTTVMILVTFLVVIFLLNSPAKASYWLDIGNMSYHCLAPLLFVLDYILFEKKGTMSVFAPLYSLILPLIYVAYIFILGAVIENFEYPYFFLNVNELGYGNTCLWVLVLVLIFTVLGYLLWLWNRFGKFDGKWKFDFSNIRHTVRERNEA